MGSRLKGRVSLTHYILNLAIGLIVKYNLFLLGNPPCWYLNIDIPGRVCGWIAIDKRADWNDICCEDLISDISGVSCFCQPVYQAGGSGSAWLAGRGLVGSHSGTSGKRGFLRSLLDSTYGKSGSAWLSGRGMADSHSGTSGKRGVPRPQPVLMPFNVPAPPATTVPPGPTAWLAGREHTEEAIRDASVLEPQDSLRSTKLTVQDDEDIHSRELEPKLCYWDGWPDETVLVQLSEEIELPVEVVERNAVDSPLGSAWLAGREDHKGQNNPVQQTTHDTSRYREKNGISDIRGHQAARKLSNVWLLPAVDKVNDHSAQLAGRYDKGPSMDASARSAIRDDKDKSIDHGAGLSGGSAEDLPDGHSVWSN